MRIAILISLLAGCSSIDPNPVCEVLGEPCRLNIQSCYLNHGTGAEQCANTGTPTEGQPCATTEVDGGDGIPLTNGCADGLGCNLVANEDQGAPLTCSKYCDATSANNTCAQTQRCCEIRSFYACGAEASRAGLGFCVDPANFPNAFAGLTGCPDPDPPAEGCPQ